MLTPPSDEQINLEFAWTPVTNLCRNIFDFDTFCHRDRDRAHDVHAAGFEGSRIFWVESDSDDLPPTVIER